MAVHALLLGVVFLASLGATVADLNEAGKAAYARGDYMAAERLFAQAIARAPEEPALRYHLAVTLTRLGRWREASREYEAVLRLAPSLPLAAAAREGLRGLAPLTRKLAGDRADADDATIPLQKGRGGWFTEVVLNNTQPGRFLVDTGSSLTVISPGFARALGIDPPADSRSVELQTFAGRTRAPLLTISSVRVGEVEASNVPAVVIEMGPDMDGVLGNTFLSRYTVTLDPKRGVLGLRSR